MISITSKIPAFKNWILRFIQLQLFITIVSLPILLAWGLPLSILSPIGNLIFSPVLTLFLFLCSLIFFCELFHLPNTLFITTLERVTDWWLNIMFSDSQTWLVGFIRPPLLVMIIIPIIAFFIIMHKKTRPIYRSIFCLTLLSVCVTVYLKCAASPRNAVTEIPCNRGNVTVLKHNNSITVIDPGYLGQRINAASWAQYTLMPALISTIGSTTIDHLILMQPSSMLFQGVERLATKMNIKNIYLVCWQKQASKSFMRNFFTFKNTITAKNIHLVRISNKMHTISLDDAKTITITPLKKMIKATDIAYPALTIDSYIDNQEITLYSAKYAKKLKSSSKRKA